jgi:hypothetical protein
MILPPASSVRGRMKNFGLLLAAVILTLVQGSLGQDFGEDVDNLTVEYVSDTVSRLTWTGPLSVDCESVVTYSVFRGKTDDFSPSVKNRIAIGLSRTIYLAREKRPLDKDIYYSVKAEIAPASCELHAGYITVYPLDMGAGFSAIIAKQAVACTAITTSEIVCSGPLSNFHAAIANQGGHDYLIGCGSSDYEMGAWTCANLTPGVYTIGVHSQTLTVWNSGLVEMNPHTGKIIAPITPVFSILTRIK